MRQNVVVVCLLVMLTAVHASASQKSLEASASGATVEKLAEGVYAVIRKEPPALFIDANSLFIVGETQVVVVDANLTPASAKQTLAAIRSITDKPVKYVINTHWHQDHVGGNQAYQDAFPNVEFVAHSRTRSELVAKAEETRKLYIEQGPKYADNLNECIKKNQSLAGDELTADERESYEAAVALIERYVAEAPGMRTVLPTITFDDRLTLYCDKRTIELRYLGRAHTDKDIVVYLPDDGILAAGDIVVAPVPLIGDQSFIADWGPTLNRILDLHPRIIVPGHGPLLRDETYVRLMADLMAFISKQTTDAVKRGESLDDVRKSVNLTEFKTQFTHGAKALRIIFASYVTGPAVEKAFKEASEAANER